MTGWVRSSACSCGDCVEIEHDPPIVRVRDSTHPDTYLTFTTAEWDAFTAGVRNGEFDLPEDL